MFSTCGTSILTAYQGGVRRKREKGLVLYRVAELLTEPDINMGKQLGA